MKGTFGVTLGIVIALVFAVTALILIWHFNEKIAAFFGGVLGIVLKGILMFLRSSK